MWGFPDSFFATPKTLDDENKGNANLRWLEGVPPLKWKPFEDHFPKETRSLSHFFDLLYGYCIPYCGWLRNPAPPKGWFESQKNSGMFTTCQLRISQPSNPVGIWLGHGSSRDEATCCVTGMISMTARVWFVWIACEDMGIWSSTLGLNTI